MKILAVINEKGGVGKTFITTQFAYFCRYKLGNRVLVIDLDQQNNSGDILTHSGLSHVNKYTSGNVLKDGDQVTEPSGFTVVAGDDTLLELESLNEEPRVAQNLNDALNKVADDYDLCIIDCPPSADVRQLAALSVATHYLIPFQAKSESISGVDKTMTRASIIAQEINPELQFTGLLLSMVKMQGIQRQNYEQIMQNAGNLLLKKYNPKTRKEEADFCFIPERSEFTAAQQYFRPVFYAENGKARKESTELARVWISLIHKIGLPVNKPIRIALDPETKKLKEIIQEESESSDPGVA